MIPRGPLALASGEEAFTPKVKYVSGLWSGRKAGPSIYGKSEISLVVVYTNIFIS